VEDGSNTRISLTSYDAYRATAAVAARVNNTGSLVSDLGGLIVCVMLYRAHARWLEAIGPE
jgi:hypothetical protein